MFALWLLSESGVIGINLALSKVLSTEVAMVNNFIWNEVWTFRDLRHGPICWPVMLHRFLQFNLVCASGMLISVALLSLLVHVMEMNLYLANFMSIIIVSGWNFGLSLRFNSKETA